MDTADIMWVAGILEGEAWFGITGATSKVTRKEYLYPRIKVGMTDKDIVDRLQEITGVGTVRSHKVKPGRKPMWEWAVQDKKSVMRLLLAVYPVMSIRRQEKIAEITMAL